MHVAVNAAAQEKLYAGKNVQKFKKQTNGTRTATPEPMVVAQP